MRIRTFMPWVAGLILGNVAAIGAQQTPLDKIGSTVEGPKSSITVAGCVQKETSVLKLNPAAGQISEIGLTDEFVLTHAQLNPKPMDEPNPEAQPPVGTFGSPGNLGKVYRVTGDKENELKLYVGQRVEITGTFKREEDAKTELGAVGTSGRIITGELTTTNTPEIIITAIKPVSGLCLGSAAR